MSEQRREQRKESGEARDGLLCAVARDLMPLVIDGVASPESGELVRAHLKTCDACREVYERMRAGEGAKEPVPALRDVMRALRRRLSLRAALAAAAAALLTCAALQVLLTVSIPVPASDVDQESVNMMIGYGHATLCYVTRRNRQAGSGCNYRFEENPERENELTLVVSNRTTPLRRLADSVCYALTGEGMVLHEINLNDLAGTVLRFGEDGCSPDGYPPEVVLTSVVYREDVGDETAEGLVLWQAEKEQYAELTLEALSAESQVMGTMDGALQPMEERE